MPIPGVSMISLSPGDSSSVQTITLQNYIFSNLNVSQSALRLEILLWTFLFCPQLPRTNKHNSLLQTERISRKRKISKKWNRRKDGWGYFSSFIISSHLLIPWKLHNHITNTAKWLILGERLLIHFMCIKILCFHLSYS